MYASDMNISVTGKTTKKLNVKLDKHVTDIHGWSNENRIATNTTKTRVGLFTS